MKQGLLPITFSGYIPHRNLRTIVPCESYPFGLEDEWNRDHLLILRNEEGPCS